MTRAIELIRSGDTLWYDYCAEYGQLPDNVAHMRSIQRTFAEWLAAEGL